VEGHELSHRTNHVGITASGLGLNLSRDRKLDTAPRLMLIYRKRSGHLGRRRHRATDHPPSTLPRATRVFLRVRVIRARFFRLIESYGFADERRRGNALPEIVTLSLSLTLFFSARAKSRSSPRTRAAPARFVGCPTFRDV
jgi:hypothetical protein